MSYKCNPGVLPKSEVVEALLPCPFCGGPACIVYDSGNEVMNQKWCVGCAKCGMQAIERGSNSWSQGAAAKREDAAAKARAIRIWNRRALTAPAAQGELPSLPGPIWLALKSKDGEWCELTNDEQTAEMWAYGVEYVYTADQMHAYARTAVSAASQGEYEGYPGIAHDFEKAKKCLAAARYFFASPGSFSQEEFQAVGRTVFDCAEYTGRLPGDVLEMVTDEAASQGAQAVAWDRITQGLIEQLPSDHDGRNSWLLNHGVGEESDWLRAEHQRYTAEWREWRHPTPKPIRRKYPHPSIALHAAGEEWVCDRAKVVGFWNCKCAECVRRTKESLISSPSPTPQGGEWVREAVVLMRKFADTWAVLGNDDRRQLRTYATMLSAAPTPPKDAREVTEGVALLVAGLKRIRDYSGNPETPVRNSVNKSALARSALLAYAAALNEAAALSPGNDSEGGAT